MAEVKKGSYPSRQLRAGPAPLASFEDLPSDELESPDSLGDLEECTVDSHVNKSADFDDSSTSRTLTASALSTPQLDSDGDSQFTLTPCDGVKSQTPSSFKTASLSSLLKNGKDSDPASLASVGHKKGSVSSLSVGESSRSAREDTHRKGSWTDIFRTRSRSRSRSPQGSPQTLRKGSNTSVKCNSDTEANEKNDYVSKKEKSKFLSSLFKIGGKKSPKGKNHSPKSPKSPIESQSIPIVEEIKKNIPTVYSQPDYKHESSRISDNKELLPTDTTVIDKQKHAEQVIQHQSLSNKIEQKEEKRSRPTEIELETIHGLPTAHTRHKCKEVLDYSSVKTTDVQVDQKIDQKESPQLHVSDIEGDHESSESELTFEVEDSSKAPLQKRDSEEDYEAENLLNQDSMDTDEFPAVEFQLPPPETSQTYIKTPTRKQRLEVTTIPIERPRSTTPINIAPLEAFIQSATPSPDPSVEKIRLSLPGEQFVLRPKSPKKGGLKSWQDFCEEGLHSPRLHKRPQNEEDEFDLPLRSPFLEDDGADIETEQKLSDNSGAESASWVTFENILDQKSEDENALNIHSSKDTNSKENIAPKNHHSFKDNFDSRGAGEQSNLCADYSSICQNCGCEFHHVTSDIVNGKHSGDSNSMLSDAKGLSERHSESHIDSLANKQCSSVKSIDGSSECDCDCHKKYKCASYGEESKKCISSDKEVCTIEDKQQ